MDPADPGDPFDPTGQSRPSAAPKVLLALVGFMVLAALAGGALLLVANSGGDDTGDDDLAEVATADQSDETTTTEPTDEDDEEDDTDKPDADHDGVPDTEDADDDGDGIPDTEDSDDDGDGTPDGDEPGGGEGDPGDEGEPGDDEGEDPGDEDPPAALDLLRNDPRPAVDAWIDAAGDGAKAVEVVLYPDYGFADIRDPEHPSRILEFGWRDGSLQGPERTDPFPGTDLDAESFRMTRVNWDALPDLVANAPERANLPRGEVTHVIVTSDVPFSDRFIFRIYVTAPNGSDYVVATIDGHPADR
jgi:hypothetical protein